MSENCIISGCHRKAEKYRGGLCHKCRLASRRIEFKQDTFDDNDPNFISLLKTKLAKIKKTRENDGLIAIDSRFELYIKFDSILQRDKRPCDYFNDKLDQQLKNLLLHKIETIYKPAAKKLMKYFDPWNTYSFDCFSLLWGINSKQQLPHIDLEEADYQFAIPLCDNCNPTLISNKPHLTIEEAQQRLNCDCLDGNLITFKDVLYSRGELESSLVPVSPENWNYGTISCIRGGNVHAGPAQEDYRCVLFFVATKFPSSGVYDPTSQWHGWSLVGKLHELETDKDRKYKLSQAWISYLAQYCDHPFVKIQFEDKDTTQEDKDVFDFILDNL